MKYFWRLLALPFMLGFVGLFYIRLWFKDGFYFIKYGGELIKYRKNDTVMIYHIYEQLKKIHE